MNKVAPVLLVVALFILTVSALAGERTAPFSPYVDGRGNISLPRDFRLNWVHLGSWAVPAQTDPGSGFHDVYAQPESVKAYRKTGRFPDGTVIVDEIHKAEWDEMTTGHVVHAGEKNIWFVMVKDSKGRFPVNPNWGDGWGWAEFRASADKPKKNVSTDYKEDCLPCHEDARRTDWVYVQGYPTLMK